MDFNTLFGDREINELMAALVASNQLIPKVSADGVFAFGLDKRIPPKIFEYIDKGGITKAVEMYVRSRVIVEGPKIIRLNCQELEALEETSLTLDIDDYVQPFPTVIFEFPENYTKERLVDDPFRSGKQHAPTMAIMTYHEGAVIVCIILSSMNSYTTVIYKHKGVSQIDALLEELLLTDAYDGSITVTVSEHQIMIPTIRAMMNACLAMDLYGVKRLGSANPGREAVLKKFLSKKKNKHTEKNKEELRMIPVLYGFDQHVKLYETEHTVRNPSNEGWTITTPYWRRGHWRNQRYGVGNSQIKRIRIAPVLCRKDLFKGTMQDARVTYSIG